MRFLEKDVLRALTNPFIVEKIGGEYIYNMVRGDDNGKTWITYSELDNGAGRYAEGVESTSIILFQVDIWSFSPVKGGFKRSGKHLYEKYRISAYYNSKFI